MHSRGTTARAIALAAVTLIGSIVTPGLVAPVTAAEASAEIGPSDTTTPEPTPSPEPTATPEPTPTAPPEPTPPREPIATASPPPPPPSPALPKRGAKVAHERLVSIFPSSLSGRAWEPIVATHPTDPARIAVIYQHRGTSFRPVVRISHDGGRTWRTAPGRPAGTTSTDQHAALAWGPGPQGRARLYYVNMRWFPGGIHRLATSYSDNEGRTWSAVYTEMRTPGWVGGFPDITVDRNPASPNYGVVYLTYNWLADARKGPGLRLLASADFGRTWKPLEVPVAKTPKGYGDTWRIDYRVRTAPDGAVYVSFWQADLRRWSSRNIFAKGGTGNTGRIGFSVARVVFDRGAKTFTRGRTVMAARLPESSWNMGAIPAGTGGGVYTDPTWSQGLDVDQATGRVYLAVGSSGTIRVYRSDDHGRTWTYRTIRAAARVKGRTQVVWKPNLVVGPGFVMVTMHTLDRVRSGATVGNAFSVSYNGGRTWSRPTAVNPNRWRATNLAKVSNGPGLRERADLTADGNVYFVYGDGRLASGSKAGRGAIYGALIRVSGATGG